MVCARPGQRPQRQVFSQCGSYKLFISINEVIVPVGSKELATTPKNSFPTCARASIQVPISLLVTWDITKLMVFAVSAVFINLGPGDGGRALKKIDAYK